MFGIFKNKKQEEQKENEYSFIWYKKVESGNKTFYTQPFRTKVKAKNFEEAKEKVTNFALHKMKLVIVSEDNFDKTDLGKIDKAFDSIYKQMDEIFEKFK